MGSWVEPDQIWQVSYFAAVCLFHVIIDLMFMEILGNA